MINNQKTYFPDYKKMQYSLWIKHIREKERAEGRKLSLVNIALELFGGYCIEKYGYKSFDYIISGDDPLLSVISALEKVMLGKSVLIIPSRIEKEEIPISQLIDKRTELFNESMIIYINERYNLNISIDNLTLNELIVSISDKINEFKDSEKNPLCFLYKGREVYSNVNNHGSYKSNQIFWPKIEELSIDAKWNSVERKLNRFSLLSKEKHSKNREIKGFITAKKVILTSRVSNDFCSGFYEPPVLLGDSFLNTEDSKRFNLRHRLADVLGAMSINKVENEPKMINNFNKMYK